MENDKNETLFQLTNEEKKIILTEEERKQKEERIERLKVAMQGMELHIPAHEKEIELDLPAKNARIQAREQLKQMKLNVSNYQKEIDILNKQISEWK